MSSRAAARSRCLTDDPAVGNGYIRVQNPRQYDLTNGRPSRAEPDGTEVYAVSITHQLHCLVSERPLHI